MRFSLLLLASTLLGAADLAVWQVGPGTIADAPAAQGATIADHVVVASGDKAVRLTLAAAPTTSLILAPSSSLSLEERDGQLQVTLLTGIVQADVKDKGPYSAIHVLGAVFDVRVTGTLFLVERVKGDTDYIALIEGKVTVSLREEVAKSLGREVAPVELSGRQGLEASSSGFGAVAALTARPQLSVAGESRSVRSQAAEGTGGGWATDAAAAATAAAVITTEVPTVAPPVVAPVVIPTDSIVSGVTEQVRQSVVQDVSTAVSQQVQQQVQQAVIQTITSPAALGRPPGPPSE